MKKNWFWGILAILLVLGFIGCGGDTTEDEEFTVTFDLDGGNINSNTNSVQIKVKSGGTIANLPNPQKTENSIGFGGWFAQKNGIGNEFTSTTKVLSNLTVYAKWINPFIGKWDGKNSELEFFADLTFLSLIYDINAKGTYSFTATEMTQLFTHCWIDSSWDDSIGSLLVYKTGVYFFINNDQMWYANETFIKQNL
jgi:hypothetical protein